MNLPPKPCVAEGAVALTPRERKYIASFFVGYFIGFPVLVTLPLWLWSRRSSPFLDRAGRVALSIQLAGLVFCALVYWLFLFLVRSDLSLYVVMMTCLLLLLVGMFVTMVCSVLAFYHLLAGRPCVFFDPFLGSFNARVHVGTSSE